MNGTNKKKNNYPRFLDLFAGAGGLSEGFYRAGFQPVSHVELASSACYTLKTRAARHWLFEMGEEDVYICYLNRKISRDELYKHIPSDKLSSVINAEICKDELPSIFSKIDELSNQKKLILL